MEWDLYVTWLYSDSIIIGVDADKLAWIDDCNLGVVTAKLDYHFIADKHLQKVDHRWHKDLWKYNIPLKVKSFAWLCINHRINTLEMLWKKGWCGPNICFLCLNGPETDDHLFCVCTFGRAVFASVVAHYGLGQVWMGSSLRFCLDTWLQQGRGSLYLLFLYLAYLESQERYHLPQQKAAGPIGKVGCS